jgi:hypothetical protein
MKASFKFFPRDIWVFQPWHRDIVRLCRVVWFECTYLDFISIGRISDAGRSLFSVKELDQNSAVSVPFHLGITVANDKYFEAMLLICASSCEF